MKTRIFVSCPHTTGNVVANTRKACEAAKSLAEQGFAPYLPHGNQVWDLVDHHPREFWVDLAREFVPACAAVLRVEGESTGVEEEVKLAKSLGIPVFTDVAQVVAHFSKKA